MEYLLWSGLGAMVLVLVILFFRPVLMNLAQIRKMKNILSWIAMAMAAIVLVAKFEFGLADDSCWQMLSVLVMICIMQYYVILRQYSELIAHLCQADVGIFRANEARGEDGLQYGVLTVGDVKLEAYMQDDEVPQNKDVWVEVLVHLNREGIPDNVEVYLEDDDDPILYEEAA